MAKAVVTVDLGFGDSGKGATVDALTRHLNADLVIRYSGGAQCVHTVTLPDNRAHTFAQWSSGTLAGADTYLSRHVVVDPMAMLPEAEDLTWNFHVTNPYEKLIVDRDALIATRYHKALNRLRELSRGSARHGSCGMGVGATREYDACRPTCAIRAKDIREGCRSLLADKMVGIRDWCKAEAEKLRYPRDVDTRSLRAILEKHPKVTAAAILSASEKIQITSIGHGVPSCKMVIFEPAQGVLLDEWIGFFPHVTRSTVTAHHAVSMLVEIPNLEQTCSLGIMRSYMTRHGAGPLPTFNMWLSGHMSDPHNPTNPWQQGMRYGWPDMMLWQYAIDECGCDLDGLVMNHLDDVEMLFPDGNINICEEYGNMPVGLTINDMFARGRSTRDKTLFTAMLDKVQPEYRIIGAHELTTLFEPLSTVIEGYGPTWMEKTILELPWKDRKDEQAEMAGAGMGRLERLELSN